MKKEFHWYGYIYLLQCGDQFKIGFSVKPRKRVKQMRTGSPHAIRLIHTLRTTFYKSIEKQLHLQFAAKRTRGEWFALNDEDVAYIKSLNRMGYSPEEQAERDRSEAEYNAKQAAIQEAANQESMQPIWAGLIAGAGELGWVDTLKGKVSEKEPLAESKRLVGGTNRV